MIPWVATVILSQEEGEWSRAKDSEARERVTGPWGKMFLKRQRSLGEEVTEP